MTSFQDLRDMFASMAMQALMADASMVACEPEDIAAAAYEQAEAMMFERAKRYAKEFPS